MNKIKKGISGIDRIIETSRKHHSCEINVTSKQGVVNVYLRDPFSFLLKNEKKKTFIGI